jgi:hypothetical protein
MSEQDFQKEGETKNLEVLTAFTGCRNAHGGSSKKELEQKV